MSKNTNQRISLCKHPHEKKTNNTNAKQNLPRSNDRPVPLQELVDYACPCRRNAKEHTHLPSKTKLSNLPSKQTDSRSYLLNHHSQRVSLSYSLPLSSFSEFVDKQTRTIRRLISTPNLTTTVSVPTGQPVRILSLLWCKRRYRCTRS